MASLTCSGSEWSLEECSWTAPDEACLSHAGDAVVYCSSAGASVPQGAVRLISSDGSPSINGAGRPEVYVNGAWRPICSSGISSGASAVICKSMGFSGAVGAAAKCSTPDACGDAAPGVSELACSGQESGVLTCPHEAGDDVFCAPSESVVVSCTGNGDTQGSGHDGLEKQSWSQNYPLFQWPTSTQTWNRSSLPWERRVGTRHAGPVGQGSCSPASAWQVSLRPFCNGMSCSNSP